MVSLDLDEAAPRGGGPAEKTTAIVYMLARFVLGKDFYLNPDILPLIPDDYRAHHEVRIRRIRETPKRLIADEFHRTKNSPIIRDQFKTDMREGRKWGIQIALSSQLLDDFDEDMIGLATGYWIMGVNADRDAYKAKKIFGLSDSACDAILNDLRGPGPGGAPFLAVLQLKDGKHEHLLVNTLGPIECWAYSTTAEDVSLRTRLYAVLGAVEARKRLARRFPGGSAKSEIERRVEERAERGESTTEAAEGVIGELARETACSELTRSGLRRGRAHDGLHHLGLVGLFTKFFERDFLARTRVQPKQRLEASRFLADGLRYRFRSGLELLARLGLRTQCVGHQGMGLGHIHADRPHPAEDAVQRHAQAGSVHRRVLRDAIQCCRASPIHALQGDSRPVKAIRKFLSVAANTDIARIICTRNPP